MSQKKKQKKAGRPPKPKSQKMGELITLKCTKAEKRAVVAEARAQGVSVGELLMRPFRKDQK